MAQNFLVCDREQAYLMPPSVGEWLMEGHLAWFVLDALERVDLAGAWTGPASDNKPPRLPTAPPLRNSH